MYFIHFQKNVILIIVKKTSLAPKYTLPMKTHCCKSFKLRYIFKLLIDLNGTIDFLSKPQARKESNGPREKRK